MATKHTQGPWNIHRYGDTGLRHVPEEAGGWAFRHIDVAHGDKLLAQVQLSRANNGGWPTVTDEAELEANARLIAAAPELLDVVKTLRDYVADGAAGVFGETIKAMALDDLARIDAAIAKAEGAQ